MRVRSMFWAQVSRREAAQIARRVLCLDESDPVEVERDLGIFTYIVNCNPGYLPSLLVRIDRMDGSVRRIYRPLR